MTQNELIDMFRMSDKDLDVEEIVNFAVKWEREECAKLVESLWNKPVNGMATEESSYADVCARAIRDKGLYGE